MQVNVYRVTILVVDHDQLGAQGVADALEQARYPNHCISPHVLGTEQRTVEWSDDHPLNRRGNENAAVEELFGP